MSARQFFSKIGSAINTGLTAMYLSERRELARKLQYHGARLFDIENEEDLKTLDAIASLIRDVEAEARAAATKTEW